MPNNAYLRSTKREREVMNEYRLRGFISARSAGSHSAVDVWAVSARDALVDIIQIKTNKGGRFLVKKCIRTYPATVSEYLYTYTGAKNASRQGKANRSRKIKTIQSI